MGPLRCLLGRHRWEPRRNPEVGGADANYDVCSRCGKERAKFGPRPPGTIGG